MLFEMNSVCLKITTDGKHKGESKNVQQQKLAYQIPAGGTRTRTAGTIAVQPMTAALQQTVVQTAIGQVSRSHSTQHTQQGSSGQVIGTSQKLLN